MNFRSLLLVCFPLVALSAVACAGPTEEEDSASAEEDLSLRSPEALARWLGTNHSVAFLGQYLDTRPGGLLPTLEFPEQGFQRWLTFTPAVITDPAIKSILAHGKEADRVGLPIVVGRLDTEPSFGDATCLKPGIYVNARNPQWSLEGYASIDTMKHVVNQWFPWQYSPAEKAEIQTLDAEANVDVVLALPGDVTAPVIVLNFGVVTRQLNPAAGSTPGLFWTMLGAQKRSRCDMFGGE